MSVLSVCHVATQSYSTCIFLECITVLPPYLHALIMTIITQHERISNHTRLNQTSLRVQWHVPAKLHRTQTLIQNQSKHTASPNLFTFNKNIHLNRIFFSEGKEKIGFFGGRKCGVFFFSSLKKQILPASRFMWREIKATPKANSPEVMM